MATAEGAGLIQAKLNHALAEPSLGPVGIETLRRGDQQRRFPDQQAHVEIGPRLDQQAQLVADLGLPVAGAALGIEPGARIELPAQQDDRALGLVQR